MARLFAAGLFALAMGMASDGLTRDAALPDDCLPLSQVHAGMTGVVLSVIDGFELETYEVEILGVETSALPGSAMILGRLKGKGLEQHGIVAGMSGSPVLIDGKFIGAVAYSWQFSYNPIAGITPIEQMYTLWDDLDKEPPRRGAGSGSGKAGANANGGWNWRPQWEAYLQNERVRDRPEPLTMTPTSAAVIDAVGSEPIRMQPLGSPFFTSMTSTHSIARLQPFFESRGLNLMAAGSSAGSDEKPPEPSPPIVAGSSLGIPMMTGDSTITSLGTVTYRKGDKLLAFGHPMFSEGSVDIPMSKAFIFTYMQSYARSFKLGEVREIVGAVRQDRAFAIGGVFGKAPPRVDMSVRVDGPAASRPRTFHFSIWENEDFLPLLAGTALLDSISGAVGDSGDLTADCHYSIELEGGRKIEKDLRTSSRGSIGLTPFLSMTRDLFLLEGNPFEQADLKAIDVEVEVRPGYRFDALQKATPRYTRIRPGGKVEIDLTWKPFRGEQYSERLGFDTPEDLEPGSYVVHLADASVAGVIDLRHAPARFTPRGFEDVVDVTERLEYPANKMWIYLFEPALGMSLRNQSMQGLPGSIRTLVATTAAGEIQRPITGRQISMRVHDYEFPITGRASFTIDVVPYLAE